MAFDQAKFDAICHEVSEGRSLRSASSAVGVSHATFLTWVREDEDKANQYARARDIGVEVEFESLEDESDVPPPMDERGKVDPGWVQWQKMRLDLRKWTLARKAPKKYGDKIETTVQGPDGGAVQVITRRVVDPSQSGKDSGRKAHDSAAETE